MSEESPSLAQNGSALQNPQVLIALITGVVSVLVAVIGLMPVIIAANTPPTATPTSTYTHTYTPTLTATVAPTDTPVPTETPTVIVSPTLSPTPEATTIEFIPPSPTEPIIQPTAAVEVVVNQLEDPNVLLIWDSVSFTLVNSAGEVVSLENVKFRSDNGKWDARDWGPSVYTRLPDDNCLRMRYISASPRNPPGECGKLFGLIEVGDSALFWLNTAEFQVQLKKEVLATCNTDAGQCAVFIPQG